MKKILLAASALCALIVVTTASAADMRARPILKAPAPVPVWSWTGFYAGINFGYSVGSDGLSQSGAGDFSVLAGPETRFSTLDSTIAPKGGFLGMQGGFNYQTGPIVWGVEGDWQWANQRATSCGHSCAFVLSPDPIFGTSGTRMFPVSQRVNWFATARGRVGWTPLDGAMIYATAGGAWMGVDLTDGVTASFPSEGVFAATTASSSKTLSGYAAGAGVELQLWGNWTGKLEYLHIDVGGITSTGTHSVPPIIGPLVLTTATSRITDDIFRLGLNYKLGPAGMIMASAPLAGIPVKAPLTRPRSLWNWSGFYIGANGGYGVATDNFSQTSRNPLTPVVTFNSIDNTIAPKGGFLGLQGGFNYQTGPIVWGVEGDWQWGNQSATSCARSCLSSTFAPPTGTTATTNSVNQQIGWFATARGRVGWTPLDGAMIYATAGGAWMGVDLTDGITSIPPPIAALPAVATTASFSKTLSGYAAGGGVELQLWGNWTGKLEYLHIDVGGITATAVHSAAPPIGTFSVRTTTTSRIKDDAIRLGLNYKLDNYFVK